MKNTTRLFSILISLCVLSVYAKAGEPKSGATGCPTITVSVVQQTNISCYGECNGSATINANGGTMPYTYVWNYGASTSAVSSLCAGTYPVTATDSNGCTGTTTITIVQPPLLTATVTTIPASCGACNGSISVTPAGGTTPYTYNWGPQWVGSDPLNGLCGGTYSLTLTDFNGCTYSDTNIIVNSSSQLSASIKSTQVTCNGGSNGSVCANIINGTPPYNFIWNNNATSECLNNLTAGNYTVVVTDANKCTDTAFATIRQPAVITAIASANPDTICSGGVYSTLSANATGGNGIYTFLWNMGTTTQTIQVNPATTTTYTVLASDTNGCKAVPVSVTVTVNPPLVAIANASRDSIASGDTVTLYANATGGDGIYTYSWLPGSLTAQKVVETLTHDQTYSVVVSDGCANTNISSIIIYVDTNFNALSVDSLIKGGCNNSMWVASNGAVSLNQFTFLWSNGATTDTINNLCAGTYTVTITDTKPVYHSKTNSAAKQIALKKIITITDPSGISELYNKNLFTLYPVPTSGKLTIQLANGYKQTANSSVIVYDITGRQILKHNFSFKTNTESLDVSGLANGIYLLMLSDGKTTSQAKFTVIQ